MRHHLTDPEIRRAFALPDERLVSLPLVSIHGEPQDSPQEYDCGCVTVTRITDRDYRRGERPFEMRLAVACETAACETAAGYTAPWQRELDLALSRGGAGGTGAEDRRDPSSAARCSEP